MKIRRAFVVTGLAMLAALLAAAVFVAAYYGIAAQRIAERFDQLRSARGTRFFATFPAFRPGQRFRRSELIALVEDQGFVERSNADELVAGEFAWTKTSPPALVVARPSFQAPGRQLEALRARLVFEMDGVDYVLKAVERYEDGAALEQLETPPRKIASFVAGRLRSQDSVPISEIPSSMRFAIMAIEDQHFLDHTGVSFRAIARALWRDLKAMRFVEGGSTITQQLMKNLFFSSEKSLLRKVKEAFYAIVAEANHPKEDILEAYLNEVYLGQWGTRQVHGVAEGAEVFFRRSVARLTTSQSALLAAIVQAPNALDPTKNPERSLKRRNLVLKRMRDVEFITEDEYQAATKEPLGVVPAERSFRDTDYYLDLVMQKLPPPVLGRIESEALTIYMTLNPYLQAQASRALNDNLTRLRKAYAAIRKKEEKGRHLQSALVAIDPQTCDVLALQGGHSYRSTQFNRVLSGRRQPGSLFKPFVFYTAFAESSREKPFTAITELEDAPFEWKYDDQLWKPKNYDGEFRGMVTARQALEQSLNTPTARLAQTFGVNAIVGTLYRAGIRTELPRVPSIALGSATVTPMELAEAYVTLANLGGVCTTRTVFDVYDESGNVLLQNDSVKQQVLAPQPAFQTVNLLKGVFVRGTAKGVQIPGLTMDHFAGKTGTTNEGMDAWFVGFSPSFVALVWVGFDEEEKLGMTGGSAALPAWIDFVRTARPFLRDVDFPVPEGLAGVEVDPKRRCATAGEGAMLEYFSEGTEPPPCPQP
jgi:penicillin-binding protein 1B